MSVKHTTVGVDSYIELTGFIMVEEAKEIIEKDWQEIIKTLDTDPIPFDHEAFRYIAPEEDASLILPSISKYFKTELKKMYEGVKEIYEINFMNENFSESNEKNDYSQPAYINILKILNAKVDVANELV